MTNEEMGERLSKQHKRNVRNRSISIAVVAGAFIIIVISITNNTTIKSKPEVYRGNHKNAFYISQQFAENYLKAPSTAEFPAWDNQTSNVVQKSGSFTQYTINSYVDAQNIYGAMIREYYVCKVEYIKATDKWRLIDFKFK